VDALALGSGAHPWACHRTRVLESKDLVRSSSYACRRK